MTQAPPIPAAGPDWQTISERIACPLCDYELRGLTTPRCPECGYTFDWSDLLDTSRHRHPYLFEHYPRKNVRAFLRTIVRNLKPGTFWQTLYPSHTVNVKRLMLYWLVCAVGAMLPIVVVVVKEAVDSAIPPLDPAAWARVFGRLLDDDFYHFLAYQAVLMAGLPLLSAATLQIYRQSMQAARVLPRHALRCAIYSGDVIFWNGIWQACVVGALDISRWDWRPGIWYLLAGFVVTFVLDTRRLEDAYRKYMKFPDAMATVICSQFMVLLVLCIATSGSLFLRLFEFL